VQVRGQWSTAPDPTNALAPLLAVPTLPAARIPRALRSLQTSYSPPVVDINAPRQTRSQRGVGAPDPPLGRVPSLAPVVPAADVSAGGEDRQVMEDMSTGAGRVVENNTAPPPTATPSETSSPMVQTIPWQTEEQASINWGDFASFDTMTCLTMLDRLQLSPQDLAKTSMINLDPTTLPPERYKDQFANPMSYEEAWNHSCPFQRGKWREAIKKEFGKMSERQVWRKQKKSAMPAGRRLVKCKWIFEVKRDGKFRARLVACGYIQVSGIDYTDAFSPVVNDVTFRIMLIAKMMWKLESHQFDVETAFLLGDLEEEIYMECPPGMEAMYDECLLLLKCIYGLVQAQDIFIGSGRAS